MAGDRALLVCAQGRDKLAQWLTAQRYRDCDAADTVVSARRMVAGDPYALILINAPLPDETGFDFALELAQQTTAAVLVLARAELLPLVSDAAAASGVLLVSKPISTPILEQTLRAAVSCRNRLLAYKSENARLQRKLEELRVIDRAKCLLIERMRVTEEEAHRILEKQAMDERLPRVRVAKRVLERFEL